jgi:hypothetical protein
LHAKSEETGLAVHAMVRMCSIHNVDYDSHVLCHKSINVGSFELVQTSPMGYLS